MKRLALAAALLAVVVGGLVAAQLTMTHWYRPWMPARLGRLGFPLSHAEAVREAAARNRLDPALVAAIIYVESQFHDRVQSASGAVGLMQLKFETAAEVAHQLAMPRLTEQDLYKPDINLVLGVAYLTRLIAQFKSFKLGLIAYNEGPGMVLYTLMKHEPLPLEYYRMVLQSYYTCKKIAERLDKQ